MSEPKPLPAELTRLVEEGLPELLEFYRQAHAAPELSFFERETSARLAAGLERAGCAVTRPVGRYEGKHAGRQCWGVVGLLDNGEGPTIMLRTDMDALPLEEQTGAPYASRVRMPGIDGREQPVMHACGHDLHMTVLLGTARTLFRLRDHWRGKLLLVGQPAEEHGSGARALLAEGLYSRWPSPRAALALHTHPLLEAGQLGFTPGITMGNIDMLDLTVRGVGAHGATPHLGRDPVVLAAQLVLALQTIVSREIDPVDPAVVTVGSIHGGNKHNIIPDQVKLELTVRALRDDTREKILAAIERIVVHTARAAGIPEERLPLVEQLPEEHFPATWSDPALAERVAGAFREALGEDNVRQLPSSTGGEDFSLYGRTAEQVPLCLFWLGTAAPGSPREGCPGWHSPRFLPAAEPALRAGVTAMSAAALRLFDQL